MKLRIIVYATFLLLPVLAFAQSGAMQSVYFGGTSPFSMFADRLLYVLFALAVAVGVMAAILKWAAPYIAPNLDEAEAIIARAAGNEIETPTGDAIIAATIVLSTTARIWIVYEAIKLFATQL